MLIGILQQSKDFPALFEQANRMTSWFLLLVLSFAKEDEFYRIFAIIRKYSPIAHI